MKRFLVFRGYDYYPSGGWSDLVGDADSYELARGLLPKRIPSDQWTQIVDTETGQVANEDGPPSPVSGSLLSVPTGSVVRVSIPSTPTPSTFAL